MRYYEMPYMRYNEIPYHDAIPHIRVCNTTLYLTYAYATPCYTSNTCTQHHAVPHIHVCDTTRYLTHAYESHKYATRHTTALYLTYAALWQEAQILKSILYSDFHKETY